ncbi:MAG TPA: cation:proton antiporter [Syntrophomonadaceae bacterium]|nr:cation:proton antiporter [Syntrophomonadaceae bacterium]
MNEYILLSLVSIIVLGIASLWLAWRFRISSVILFIFFGILAGPVLKIIQPDQLFGNLLLPLVSLSVALILFEGGLGLKFKELRTIGRTLNRLISVGVLVTWAVTSLAAYYILGMEIRIALLLGALLVVTGPTVIIPLLRHVRPAGKAGVLLKWEGILIDPVGALLAVLVFQAVFSIDLSTSLLHASLNFLQALLTGASLGFIGGYIIILLLQNRKIPEHLQSPVTLMMLMVVFVLANMLQAEAGLLAATVMGIVLANQQKANIKKIVEFKETLGSLVLAGVFIILTARLQLDDLFSIGMSELLFLAVLIFIARPLSVLISTIGSTLKWQEKTFLAFIAPRGVVAVAVTSLFALRLQEQYMIQAENLVTITFMVVIGTVLFYSIISMPLAKKLGLAQSSPQGILILGAHHWAQMIAIALQKEGFQVTMVDTNPSNVKRARDSGINAIRGNILSADIEDRMDINSLGRLLALTSNDEVNSLAALNFMDLMGKDNLYQLPLRSHYEVPVYLRGRMLFNQYANYDYLEKLIDTGAVISEVTLLEETDCRSFNKRVGEKKIPLFTIDDKKKLTIMCEDEQPVLKAESRVFFLTHPDSQD